MPVFLFLSLSVFVYYIKGIKPEKTSHLNGGAAHKTTMSKNTKNTRPGKSKKKEIAGLLFIVIAIIMLVALATHDPGDWPGSSRAFDEPYHNKIGFVGAWLSHVMRLVLGYTSYAAALIIAVTGIVAFLHKQWKLLVGPVVFLLIAGLFIPLLVALTADIGTDNTRVEPAFRYGGVFGGFLAHFMVTYLGRLGAYLVSIAAILVTVVLTTNLKPSTVVELVIRAFSPFAALVRSGMKSQPKRPGPSPIVRPEFPGDEEPIPPETMDESPFLTSFGEEQKSKRYEPVREPEITIPFAGAVKSAVKNGAMHGEPPEDVDFDSINRKLDTLTRDYVLPDTDLLDEPRDDAPAETRDEMLEQAARIVESLRHFNIESEVRQITPGPIVTRYELTLAPGVKVGRVVGLSNDLSMALRARGSIRIIAPIPGKAAIGIEVPNRKRSIVYFREIAESEAFQTAGSPLVCAIGKSTSGDTVVTDLEKMPHLLIAGSTGSGKSVCIHTIMMSILMNAAPDEVRMILIDPKVVELSIYNPIPHLLTPVITDTSRAAGSLRWAVKEMERRYRKLASLGVRDIFQYNTKVAAIALKAGEAGDESNNLSEIPESLPLIVIIIDEFADLMVVASNEIEESIARLAQMARAVGIHLVLATQRPSADVITGLIKANFPSRIAFKVMQASNSRIILDEGGADKLIGLGDMLFLQAGKPEPVRLHGAYISGEECQRVVDFVESQMVGEPRHIDDDEFRDEKEETDNTLGLRDPNVRDSLFFEAARLVVRHNQGSVSLLQRRLKIGYARAARLIDQLELAGIVSPYDGSKAREVLVDDLYINELESGGFL